MPMKRIFATLIFALPLLFCGCSEEEDILPEQRQKIVSYLERTHSPALIPESQVETGSQQRFYTMSGSTVYRYIDNFYRDGRNELPEITAAAKATITFRAYVFAFSNITDSTFPFYSNDPALQQAYEDMGLTPGAWSFEPLTLDMRGDILNGLRHDAWGQGYATEAARACIAHAAKLGIPELVAFTFVGNGRSRRVMQKLGMTCVGEFDHPALPEGHPLRRHALYRIRTEQ